MNADQQRSRAPSGVRIFSSLIRFAIGAGLVVVIMAPVIGGSWWFLDLVANLTAQLLLFSLVALGAGIWWGIGCDKRISKRRWWLALIAGVALLVQFAVLIPGRAAWDQEDDSGKGAQAGEISVLVFNAYSENLTPELALGLVEQSDSDVVVLLEQRRRFALESEIIREKFPWIEVNRPIDDRSPWMLVLSKWPMKTVELDDGFPQTPGCFPVLIESPDGYFGLVALHARSPRGTRAWRMGNESVRAVADAVRRFREIGVDGIVAGDINGTPSGWRSRSLVRESGLRRCKPFFRAAGTWPASRAWPVSVAIDDVWAPEGWRIRQWDLIGGPGYGGSDHRAIKVTLTPGMRLPGAVQTREDEPFQAAPLTAGQDQGVAEQGVNTAKE